MRGQSGASLVSLMIAAALSLFIVLSALRVFTLSASDYTRTDQDTLLQEQASHVFALLRMVLQQAGEVDASLPRPLRLARPVEGALTGLDDVTIPASTSVLTGARQGGSGGSDALAVRLSGDMHGRMRNCAGLPVLQAATAADEERGWSIFHVATNRQGEPELRCKYRGQSGWVSQALVDGVVSFQLLYGLDPDEDGLPNDFVNAARLHSLAEQRGQASPQVWTRVVAVHVALLLRSSQTVQTTPRVVALFGDAYARRHATSDPGVSVAATQLRQDRLYRHVDAVIFLANSLRPQP